MHWSNRSGQSTRRVCPSWVAGLGRGPLGAVRPWVFFATTFLLSWGIWLPLMLIRVGVLHGLVAQTALTPLAFLGVCMPAVAATFHAARAGGRAGVRDLYGRLRMWRVG